MQNVVKKRLRYLMKRISWFLVAVAAVFAALASSPAVRSAEPSSRLPPSPELSYLKQVNSWRPPSDPQLLFILLGQFANSGRHVEGIDFLSALLVRFGSQLSSTERAHYLVAIASLRAAHAENVFLLQRLGWVSETLVMLDEAKRLTAGTSFVARWMSGIVRARVPDFFGEREAALVDLQWCIDNARLAPHAGWLREVHLQAARVQRSLGNEAAASRHLALSGYGSSSPQALFTTPFSELPAEGHKFSPKVIREVTPGSVYVLSGFDFTEYYFVISKDRRQLIAIDAGTRPDTAKEALDALRTQVPDLPPLTTVLVTHAHWDHVGGHRYFRTIAPEVRFMGRSNYQDELRLVAGAELSTLRRFFGNTFSLDDVLDYKPDVSIDRRTDIDVGGTRFTLLPTSGGETEDAMLIHMPGEGVLFTGDILMPYFGAPFVEEGSPQGLLHAIEQVSALRPRHLLHGHEPLTRVFFSSQMLEELSPHVAWLQAEVVRRMRPGQARPMLHQVNLMPPTLEQSSSAVHLAYLILRENMIDRLFDQNSGYWQAGLKGLDHLSDADHGTALADYLGISERQVVAAANRMMEDGRHELAATLIRSWRARMPDRPAIEAAYKRASLKLMEKYQEFNPFKFILFGAEAGQSLPQMVTPQGIDMQRATGQ
jgi:glyoxylase-like metal-dependent hydrolase (beta-lactamase superfamily II)